MEYGIVTKSRKGLEVAAAEQGIDPDDAYVISSLSDLRFAKKDVGDGELTIVLASDWRDTGVHPQHIVGEGYDTGVIHHE